MSFLHLKTLGGKPRKVLFPRNMSQLTNMAIRFFAFSKDDLPLSFFLNGIEEVTQLDRLEVGCEITVFPANMSDSMPQTTFSNQYETPPKRYESTNQSVSVSSKASSTHQSSLGSSSSKTIPTIREPETPEFASHPDQTERQFYTAVSNNHAEQKTQFLTALFPTTKRSKIAFNSPDFFRHGQIFRKILIGPNRSELLNHIGRNFPISSFIFKFDFASTTCNSSLFVAVLLKTLIRQLSAQCGVSVNLYDYFDAVLHESTFPPFPKKLAQDYDSSPLEEIANDLFNSQNNLKMTLSNIAMLPLRLSRIFGYRRVTFFFDTFEKCDLYIDDEPLVEYMKFMANTGSFFICCDNMPMFDDTSGDGIDLMKRTQIISSADPSFQP